MISNKLKEELREKKNLIALFIFAIIMLSFRSLNIVTILILIGFIIIIFQALKWILWKFLRPASKDEEKIIKRKKSVDKIVSIIVGGVMSFLIIIQIIKFFGMNNYKSRSLTNTSFIKTNETNIHTTIDYKKQTNIHSDLNSCESLKSRFQSCVSRSYRGLECFPGTDIVLPKRCRY